MYLYCQLSGLIVKRESPVASVLQFRLSKFSPSEVSGHQSGHPETSSKT